MVGDTRTSWFGDARLGTVEWTVRGLAVGIPAFFSRREALRGGGLVTMSTVRSIAVAIVVVAAGCGGAADSSSAVDGCEGVERSCDPRRPDTPFGRIARQLS